MEYFYNIKKNISVLCVLVHTVHSDIDSSHCSLDGHIAIVLYTIYIYTYIYINFRLHETCIKSKRRDPGYSTGGHSARRNCFMTWKNLIEMSVLFSTEGRARVPNSPV